MFDSNKKQEKLVQLRGIFNPMLLLGSSISSYLRVARRWKTHLGTLDFELKFSRDDFWDKTVTADNFDYLDAYIGHFSKSRNAMLSTGENLVRRFKLFIFDHKPLHQADVGDLIELLIDDGVSIPRTYSTYESKSVAVLTEIVVCFKSFRMVVDVPQIEALNLPISKADCKFRVCGKNFDGSPLLHTLR
jgi:hypothetical protein